MYIYLFTILTVYITSHKENMCILKDGDDNALILLGPFNENTKLITLAIIKSFTKDKIKYLKTLFAIDKAKAEFLKSYYRTII
jgi:hypothetical protein